MTTEAPTTPTDPTETAPEGSVLIKAESPGTARLKPFTPDELADLVAAQTDTPKGKIDSVEVLETTHRVGIDVVLAVKVKTKK